MNSIVTRDTTGEAESLRGFISEELERGAIEAKVLLQRGDIEGVTRQLNVIIRLSDAVKGLETRMPLAAGDA
jgi:hypothetical protein